MPSSNDIQPLDHLLKLLQDPNMANKNPQSFSFSSCQLCGRRVSQGTRLTKAACDPCRASISSTSSQRPGSQPSSSGNSIPSTYLDLLDSKIAEYEHAAERSTLNSRSTNIDSGVDKSTKAAPSNSLSPYTQDPRRGSSRNKTSPPGSVVMNRFLNDTTEPDIV